jgi:hypothetical protein
MDLESKIKELEALTRKAQEGEAIDPLTALAALRLAWEIIRELRK